MSIKEIEEILHTLTVPVEFGGDFDRDEYDILYIWCEEIKEALKFPHTYAHGVSKVAFIFNNFDWVVKIPFNGYYDMCWDEESEDYEEMIWYPFECAADGWNYCNTELLKYEQLEAKGLECFLAETRFLCHSANNYPIYIQEKVIPYNEDKEERTPSKKSLSIVKEKKIQSRLSKTWVATAIGFYGEEKTLEFLNYIAQIDIEMGADLHEGNYCFRADGSPCLLDYSGWCED